VLVVSRRSVSAARPNHPKGPVERSNTNSQLIAVHVQSGRRVERARLGAARM
jgi:hypothetical protein